MRSFRAILRPLKRTKQSLYRRHASLPHITNTAVAPAAHRAGRAPVSRRSVHLDCCDPDFCCTIALDIVADRSLHASGCDCRFAVAHRHGRTPCRSRRRRRPGGHCRMPGTAVSSRDRRLHRTLLAGPHAWTPWHSASSRTVSTPGLESEKKPTRRQATYTLGEIHMDSMVVNQDALHLEVGLFAVFLVLELDECILQAVPGPLVSDDLA